MRIVDGAENHLKRDKFRGVNIVRLRILFDKPHGNLSTNEPTNCRHVSLTYAKL